MEIIIGALVTVIVQLVKKLVAKLGSDWTILLVALLTLAGAYGFYWGKNIISVEFLETWGKVAGYQFMIWGLFVRYIWPKIKSEYTKE